MEHKKASHNESTEHRPRNATTAAAVAGYNFHGNPMVGLKIPEMNETVTLEACKYCKRKFAANRIGTHMAICKHLYLAPKRKVFDFSKQRLSGTDAEPFAKNAKPVERPVSNWRKNHEDLIEAIRAARRAHAHTAKGGNPSDLPPPPPTD